MAHTKAKGTTKNGRDSASQRLGVKLFAGQTAVIGNIIIRQRGSKYLAGDGVKTGSDDTIYAVRQGKIAFKEVKKKLYDGRRRAVKVVSIV